MKLRVLIAVLLLTVSSWGAVAHQAGSATSLVNGTGTTKTTGSFTISGSNLVIVAGLSVLSSTAQLTSASWSLGGGTCYRAAQAISPTANITSFIIACPAPTAGSGTFTATWTPSAAFQMHAASYTGADQTFPVTSIESPIAVDAAKTTFAPTAIGLTASDATFQVCSSVSGNVTSVTPNQRYFDNSTTINTEMGDNTGTSAVTCNWDSAVGSNIIAARIRAPRTPPAVGSCSLPCVQTRSGSFIQAIDGTSPTFTSIVTQFANPTLAGNTLVVNCVYPSAGSITSVTDGGDTFSSGNTTTDATNAVKMSTYYALSIAGTNRIVTVAFSGASLVGGSCRTAEFEHVAATSALDGNNGTSGTSNSITTGSITPTQTGDLFVQCGFRDTIAVRGPSSAGGGFTVGNQTNITWHLMGSADAIAGASCQWGNYSSTSALNPTFTMPSAPFISNAIALKADNTKGQGPAAGIYLVSVQSQNLPFQSNAVFSGSPGYYTNAQQIQFPCSGNLIVIGFSAGGAGTPKITSITDTNGNSWTINATTAGTVSSFIQWAYAQNATCSDDNILRINISSNTVTTGDATIKEWDIQGAATSSFDKVGTATGNMTTGSTLTWCSACITPATANGLVLVMGGADTDTWNSWSGTGQNSLTDTYGNMSHNGPTPLDENNPTGAIYNSGTSAITWTATSLFGSFAGQWATEAIAFEAPASAAKPPGHAVNF